MDGDNDAPCARALFLEGSPVFNGRPDFRAFNMVHAARTIPDGEQTSTGTNGQGQQSVLCIGDNRRQEKEQHRVLAERPADMTKEKIEDGVGISARPWPPPPDPPFSPSL